MLEKLLQYIPFRIAVAFALGIAGAYYFDQPDIFILLAISTAAGGLTMGAGILFIRYGKYRRFFLLVLYLFFSILGYTSLIFRLPQNDKHHFIHYEHSKDITYKIAVIDKELKASRNYYRYIARIIRVGEIPTTGKILWQIRKDSTPHSAILPGDRFILLQNADTLGHPPNPYAFDYSEFMKKKNIHYVVYSKYSEIKAIKNTDYNLFHLAQRLRQKIIDVLDAYHIPKREYMVMKALLLGDKRELENELKDQYAKAGIIHILAVSGLHIGILLLFIHFILSFLPNYPSFIAFKSIVTLLLLFAFALLSGLSPSVTRAVLMFGLITIGIHLQRNPGLLQITAAAFLILLIVNPFYLFDIGFQLSFTAMAGIAIFYDKFYAWFPYANHFILKKIYAIIALSLSATLGTLPLTMYYFHRFPGAFLISNLLIIPWLGIMMIFGLLIIIGSLFTGLPGFIIDAYVFLLKAMNNWVQYISGKEIWQVQDSAWSGMAVIAAYIAVVLLFLFWEKKTFKTGVLFLSGIILFQVVLLREKYEMLRSDELIVFHHYKSSIIGVRQGQNTRLWSDLPKDSLLNDYDWKAYAAHYKGLHVAYEPAFPVFIDFHGKRLQIIDSTGTYFPIQADYVLIRKSPYLHPGIVADSLRPERFIIDASNYSGVIRLWQQSGVKTHYTRTDGAFVLYQK